jgi:hypothetical protein
MIPWVESSRAASISASALQRELTKESAMLKSRKPVNCCDMTNVLAESVWGTMSPNPVVVSVVKVK